MSKSKIYRPKKGVDLPEAPAFDPETGQALQVDKRKLLKDWTKAAKKGDKSESEFFSMNIDPKQAAYAKKERKD